MRRSRTLLAFVPLLFLLPTALAQESSAFDATVFTLIYGWPFLAFAQLSNVLTLVTQGTNGLYHQRALATASLRTVVAPNVDTVYSAGILDFSQQNVELDIPEIPDSQFALFSFYDIYGDNYANLGTGNLKQAGKYLLNAPDGNYTSSSAPAFGVHPAKAVSPYVATVTSPTTFGILLIRILVNATNLNAIHGWQDQIKLTNLTNGINRERTQPLAPFRSSLFSAGAIAEDVSQYYLSNLPELPSTWAEVGSTINESGIFNGGSGFPANNVNVTAANITAFANITAAAANPSNYNVTNNGWKVVRPGLAGNFDNGTAYAFRAHISMTGFLELAAPNAIYPTWSNTSDGNAISGSSAFGSSQISLARDESLLYTFVGGKPALQTTGFWSLTAYGSDGYLIPNDLNVYAVGDRSNLTYSDGALVYPHNSSSSSNATGSRQFQVLIQAADNPPPANWTSNWIPAPAGGGNISAALRWYGAQQALIAGDYQYPVVTRQAAIANSSSSSSSTSSPSPASSASSGGGGSGTKGAGARPGIPGVCIVLGISAAVLLVSIV